MHGSVPFIIIQDSNIPSNRPYPFIMESALSVIHFL